ncbi:MAG: cyclase family protein [Solirubrobacteraceae bacterium]
MSTTRLSIEEGQQQAKDLGASEGPGKAPVNGPELLSRPGRVVDLTRPIFEGMPMWFGHQKPFIFTNQDHDGFKEIWKTDTGFYARNILMSEHTGTHTDAIVEYDPDGPSLSETPLEFYYGSAVCLDLSEARFQDPDPDGRGYATEDVVRRAEAKLNEAGEEIRPGDIVLGWFDFGDRHFPSRQFIEGFPGFSFDGIEYLAAKGVVNIGTDCAGIDNSLDAQFVGHMICKKYGIVNTENLGRLGELVNQRFMFFGLPLLIEGGTGSPIRAIAYFPEG